VIKSFFGMNKVPFFGNLQIIPHHGVITTHVFPDGSWQQRERMRARCRGGRSVVLRVEALVTTVGVDRSSSGRKSATGASAYLRLSGIVHLSLAIFACMMGRFLQ
jgi:hypothetical protein